jgi:hypothetical protein
MRGRGLVFTDHHEVFMDNAMFIPLRKADAAQRLIWGRIDETPDRAGEVFDYASSKPEFAKWSSAQRAASGGKSCGNLRAMHQPSAAGRLQDIRFDDAAKSIEIVAHVVDDDAWKKVEQGVYTGFSPGGRYLSRWADGDLMRYTAQPAEISLVDLPCIPSATFTMIKSDGAVEQRGFAPLAKEGRRHSAEDLKRVQAMHDTAVDLGATCGGAADEADDGDEGPDLGKAHLPSPSDKVGLDKLAGELRGLRDELIKIAGERDALQKRVLALEALPRAGGAHLRAIDKGQDVIEGGIETAEDRLAKIRAMPDGLEKSLALIKLAHQKPTVVRY